jgi:nucleotide-binding universal stress UspA family protein
MLSIQTILHPTDFSERSEYAFGLACSLARDYCARLITLHVAAQPAFGFGEGTLPPDPGRYEESARDKLDGLQIPDANVRVERRFEEGDPAAEILRVAQETLADIIVMGSHGRRGLDRLLMGSVAEEVVRKASCPVLTVKTPLLPVTSPLSSTPAAEAVKA